MMQPLQDLTKEDWQLIFPNHPNLAPTPLQGGFSGAALYKVTVDQKDYVVRRTSGLHEQKHLMEEFAITKLAAQHHIAPHLHYENIERGIKVSEYIKNQLSPDHDPRPFRNNKTWLQQIAQLTRKLHAIDIKDHIFSEYQALSTFKSSYNKVPKSLLTALQIAKFDALAKTPWPSGQHVLSHCDLSIANLIYDGQRFWLVDWEKAGLNHPFWDMAYFANFCILSPQQGEDLLRLYLQRPADHQDIIDFNHLRNIFWGIYGIYMCTSAYEICQQQAIAMPQENHSELDLENMYRAFGQGTMQRDNVQDLYDFSTKLLEQIDVF